MVPAVGTAVYTRSAFGFRGRATRGKVAGLAAVTMCTFIAEEGQSLLQTSAFALVFPFAILAIAVRYGGGPAIATSIAGVIACDFVIVPPAMAFAMPNLKDGVTLVVMTAVAVAISMVVERLRRKAFLAERQADFEGLRNTTLSALSHDLRSPLAALVCASTALNEQAMAGPLQLQLARIVASEADRLNRIVHALFDLTRLQCRASSHDAELQSIEDLICGALTRLEPQLVGRSVRAEVPEETPLLICDPVLVEQVLVNLVENALRHAGPESPIEVTAWAKSGEMLVHVADHGPGVPPGDEERVFQKHYRGPDGSRHDGLGLGLTLCRTIVSAHGGRIWLENLADGGARVTFALPLRPAAFEKVSP